MEINKEKWTMAGIGLVIIALFSFIFLGFTGFRTVFGFIVFSFLPFYFILNNFEIRESEKIVYSIFFGLILFSSFAYWLGFVVSFKLGIFLISITLYVIAFLIHKFQKKKKK